MVNLSMPLQLPTLLLDSFPATQVYRQHLGPPEKGSSINVGIGRCGLSPLLQKRVPLQLLQLLLLVGAGQQQPGADAVRSTRMAVHPLQRCLKVLEANPLTPVECSRKDKRNKSPELLFLLLLLVLLVLLLILRLQQIF